MTVTCSYYSCRIVIFYTVFNTQPVLFTFNLCLMVFYCTPLLFLYSQPFSYIKNFLTFQLFSFSLILPTAFSCSIYSPFWSYGIDIFVVIQLVVQLMRPCILFGFHFNYLFFLFERLLKVVLFLSLCLLCNRIIFWIFRYCSGITLLVTCHRRSTYNEVQTKCCIFTMLSHLLLSGLLFSTTPCLILGIFRMVLRFVTPQLKSSDITNLVYMMWESPVKKPYFF